MTENRKFKIIVGLVLSGLILLILSIVINNRGNGINETPDEGSSAAINQVRFVNGEELLNEVGGLTAYDQIGKEMYIFATTAYEQYASEDTPIIGFEIRNLEVSEQNRIIFNGVFGSVNNSIEVNLGLLNNDRFSIDITDTKTELNIDDFLESNSQRNHFIGTLPYETEGYVIEYLPDSDEFTVNVFNNSSNYNDALGVLNKNLSETIKDESIIRYGAGDSEFDFGF